ncbi:MAG: GAF domain-containing protein [Cyanobacteriota bacterium]|nr:GAF domain-containing protein [Cyanobacteriota bacterium]
MNEKQENVTADKTQQPLPNLTQQVLLHRISTRIRQSLELQEILSATVAEVRAFSGTDRVKIYQFQPDGHGLVIAESLDENRLPPLLGLHFPADDIPPYARELFLRARQRRIVDIESHQIGITPLNDENPDPSNSDIRYRPVDPCHLEYLTAMGVKSSVVVPIVLEGQTRAFPCVLRRRGVARQNLTPEVKLPSLDSNKRLWGLLVSHHSQARAVTEDELEFVQSVVDQVSIAIAQSILLERVREQASQEASVNRVTALLYNTPTVQLQAALEETVAVFQGSGGRLYLSNNETQQPVEILTCGTQPERLDRGEGRLIEENRLWQNFLTSAAPKSTGNAEANSPTKPWSVKWMRATYALSEIPSETSNDSDIWALADIYREPLFRSLSSSFQSTQIRGLLIVPLYFATQPIGCLTLFRDEIEYERVWAGYHNPDTRQLLPRQSFEAWRNLQTGQAQPWTEADIRLARALAERFAAAAHQYRLYQQVQTLNANLEQQVQVRTSELKQSTAIANQQRTLASLLAEMQQLSEVETIFRTATQEMRQVLNVDRVAVYRFDADWGGKFLNEFGSVSPQWAKIIPAERAVWNDTYLQETQGGRYGNHKISVVNDVEQAGLSACHIEILQHYHIKAFLIAPLFVGQKLWGLLAAYQHAGPHVWEDSEVAFAERVAAQLGIALQQASSLERVKAQTQQLATIAEQQKALTGVITKIRESLEIDKIFEATTYEVRHLLKADRVAIFQFYPESSAREGEIVSEDVRLGYPSALGVPVSDRCFADRYAEKYSQRHFHAIDDVENTDLNPCYLETLTQFQVKANLVAPLFRGEELWGLLCIHQCSGARQWQEREKKFVSQIATQLGVALQQAELLHQAQKARETADAANRAKSKFLANMSHELRTPLNAILGFAQVMARDSSLNSEQKEYLDIIGRSGEHLLSLINDVLEMSKIEAGRATLNESNFDLYRLLRSLQEMLEVEAEAKDLQLRVERSPDVPQYIRTDESKLRQVLINFLGNAIKFTDKGRVILRVSSVNSNVPLKNNGSPPRPPVSPSPSPPIPQSPHLHFEVEDTGIGIPPEDIERLFNAFAQTEAGRISQEGTGLGLSISKRFVQLMGGDIAVESKAGVGSLFKFDIAIALVDPSDVPDSKPSRRPLGLQPGQPTYRILVVEDKLANRQLLVKLLVPLGFEVREATNGLEAIALCEQWHPHLIWMDMRMPVMDGYTATREIKLKMGDRAPIIIALTANAFEEDRTEALAIGCDDFVRKPCKEEILLTKIADYLGVEYTYEDYTDSLGELEAAMSSSTDSTPDSPKPLPLKILIADDNALNRMLLLQMLDHLGYKADSATNGKEAIAALECQLYNVVLMDVQMPEMNGLAATREIRSRWTVESGPHIIGVTGLTLPEEQEACLNAGMDTYLCKPICLDKLAEALNQCKLQCQLCADPQISAGLHPEEIEESEELKQPALDAKVVQELRRMGGENADSFLNNAIAAFLEEAPKLLQAIASANEQNQPQSLEEAAHSLKGMSSSLGATLFSRLCQELENVGKTGSVTVPQEVMAHLESEYTRVTQALESELLRS